MKKNIVSKDPKEFHDLLSRVEGKQSVGLRFGPTGLAAQVVAEDDTVPPETARKERVPRAAFLTFIRVIGALRAGRAIKLVPVGKKSWDVCFSPKK